jgi:hypothetical protein
VAFTTIRGATGTDTIKFEGTSAVDALFALNETAPMSVTGVAGNDIINLANSSGVVGNATVRGGEGNDTIRFTDAAGANVSRLLNSSVSGGVGDDDIFTEGSESTKFRGNEADDDFVIAGNYSNSTLNGNSGEDSFAITAGNSITLSSSKILGGGDNDGRMNFTGGDGIANAVDSRINGSQGNDQIRIGRVALASTFNISGGQGNDLIVSVNAAADGIVYNGNDGDDQITTGAANESVGGGEGDDLINAGGGTDSINAGTGNDIVNDGAGNDISLLGEGNDAYTDAAGDDTITGGAGRDTYTINAADDNNYLIGSGDSAATLTGTSQGFDIFSAGFTADNQHIDITPVAESLLGDAVTGGTRVQTAQATVGGAAAFGDIAAGTTLNVVQLDGVTEVIGGVATDVTGVAANSVVAGTDTTTTYYNQRNGDTIATSTFVTATGAAAGAGNVVEAAYTGFAFTAAADDGAASANVTTIETSAIIASTASSFAALRSQFANGTLTASGGPGNNVINYDVVQVAGNAGAAAGMNGTYIIVNNTNNILDSGDLMFEVAGGAADDINQFGIFSTSTNASAFII